MPYSYQSGTINVAGGKKEPNYSHPLDSDTLKKRFDFSCDQQFLHPLNDLEKITSHTYN